MGVKRTALEFEGKFTQVPNDWVRDVRLSRRARGLLVELMSHRVGWHVSIGTLQKAGPEGRDAVRTALAELFALGYLKRSQTQGDRGRFNEIEYELCDPPTAVGLSDSGRADSGSADVGESDTKNTSTSEDQSSEDQKNSLAHSWPTFEELDKQRALAIFDEFWAMWPRSEGKAAAFKAWQKALRKTTADELRDAAREYVNHPDRPAVQFVPHGATWLNGERWNDGPPTAPEQGRGKPTPEQRARQTLALASDLIDDPKGITA